jgi:hypothetical protein
MRWNGLFWIGGSPAATERIMNRNKIVSCNDMKRVSITHGIDFSLDEDQHDNTLREEPGDIIRFIIIITGLACSVTPVSTPSNRTYCFV